MRKKGRNKAITQIKGNEKQNLIKKQFGVKQLEKIYDQSKEQIPHIPKVYQKIKESMIEFSDQRDRAIQFDRGRADFHIHAIVTNRNDQILFHQHLIDIHDELMKRNEEYKEEIQRLQFKQQEMVNSLKLQIESVAHQLKGLKPFQERRKIIIEQKKALEGLIFKEKQIHQDELTDIHHILLDQREYYENDLRTRLEIARKFAEEYSDLHIDALTKKIADSTSSERRNLYSLETKLLDELYNIDSLVKASNYYTRQNQVLRKNIENTTVKIINYKQEKKDIEIQMLETISLHQRELSQIKDCLKEKESDIINIKISKLREENERLKREAAVSYELMKKAENSRIIGLEKSFEIDLLKTIKDSAEYVINALENKYGVTDDPLFLSQKNPMGKLIRRLVLIEKEVKKQHDSTINIFFDTEINKASNVSNSGSERNSDLDMNVDLSDLENLNYINDFDKENNKLNELSDISNTELNASISNSRTSSSSINIYENNDENNTNNSNYSNIRAINNNISDKQYSKVDVEVQTEKPIRSNRLKGIKAPPTPPNYPYQFRSELSKTINDSNFNKIGNFNKNRLNYLYYTYANTPIEQEQKLIGNNIDENKFGHLNQTVILDGKKFTPQPPDIPISSHSKAKMKLRNESKKDSTIGIDHLNEKINNLDNCESSYFPKSLTPRRRKIQRKEYHATPEFRKISNSGKIPSDHIRITRAHK